MTKKMKRVALYLRTSTLNGQTTENQRLVLEQVAEAAGWEIVHTFKDRGISGTKGREARPELDLMLKAAARREFDMIAAFALDRLGRSTQHLVMLAGELRALGVDLYLHKQAIDTTTPTGKMFFTVLAAVGEFERDMIADRVRAGLARAVAEGKQLGRPTGPSKRRQAKAGVVVKLRDGGRSIRGIAADTGMSTSTVQAILREVRT